MRKIFILSALIIFCISGISEAAARFVTFPALGECTGTSVRYRATPDTNAEILGKLNKPDRIIVLNSRTVGGQIWYEIEDPARSGTAWVFGKYIDPVYSEAGQKTEAYKIIVDILQKFGINKEKGKAYDGPGVRVRYRDNYLSFVEASRSGTSFKNISIGDSSEKVKKILGSPSTESNDSFEYRIEGNTLLTFYFEDGKITQMLFEG